VEYASSKAGATLLNQTNKGGVAFISPIIRRDFHEGIGTVRTMLVP
jgi:hypothetical protein